MAAGGNSTGRHRNTLAERKERAGGRRAKTQDDAVRDFAGHKFQSKMAPAGGATGAGGAASRRSSGKSRGIGGAHSSSSGPTDVPDVNRSTKPARKRKA